MVGNKTVKETFEVHKSNGTLTIIVKEKQLQVANLTSGLTNQVVPPTTSSLYSKRIDA